MMSEKAEMVSIEIVENTIGGKVPDGLIDQEEPEETEAIKEEKEEPEEKKDDAANKLFDILRKAKPGKNGEIQITDALKTQAKSGKVIALKYKGNRFDCGSIEGYVKATISLAKQRNIIQ